MSRHAKWKLEKTKVKVVFRLQFHATHVPHAGWDKLFISFIPADSGKATSKTTKANVRNGTCKWADPIYETTRLLQDTRTKQYDEKLYKIVVAMGTSRSSVLGEAMINLSEYADASKPSVVALPLQSCDSGAVLHVTVQLLTSKTGFREFEQQRELRERGLSTTPDHGSPDDSSRFRVSASDGTLNSHVDKINLRVSYKDKSQENPSLEEGVGPNEGYPDLAVGFDGSSNTSESLNAEKHEVNSTNEIDSLKSVVSGDLSGLTQSPQKEQGAHECHHHWDPGYLGENNDLGEAIEENSRLKGCLEKVESSINELKMEVYSLQRDANDIGSKAQKFSQILISEITSGDQLASEVSLLKSECSKLKEMVDRLRDFKPLASFDSKDPENFFRDLQLRWLQGLLVVEDKIRELQNKSCYGYHDRDLRLFLSDLESLLGILLDLKRKIGQPVSPLNSVPSEKTPLTEKKEIGMGKAEPFVSESELDTDIYQPELGPLQYLGMPGFVSRELSSVDAADAMKEKIFELLRELDESKAERESLTKKMDQMECYYESLIQELEETQRQLLGELQNLRTEHSACLYSISCTKAEMETLRQDMNEQIQRFSEEKQSLDSLNKELEKRAMAAEAAMKRARLNYSIAVNHLQKDLELLSSQVVSMFETNESLIKQAFPDSTQSFDDDTQVTMIATSEKNATYDIKSSLFQREKMGMKEHGSGRDILLEDLKRSLHVQEGLYRKVEAELYEMHSMNMYLDVFSKVLQETLIDASADIKIMKDKIDELGWKLELSTEAKELLKQRLDIALDEVCSLNDEKAACMAKSNDAVLQNQMLEANLQNVTYENLLLLQKIDDMESAALESRSYKIEYDTCIVEKTELASLLEKEVQEKIDLQTSISSLEAEFDDMRSKFDDLSIANENMQKNFCNLREKLVGILHCYNEKFISLSLCDGTSTLHLESCDLAEQLEKFLWNTCEKISLLLIENKDLMKEKNKAEVSLKAAESRTTEIKQKYENDVQCLTGKLEASSALLQRLELENETVRDRVKGLTEAEQHYESYLKELLSRFDYLEDEVQSLLAKNEGFGREILQFGNLAVEHGKTKMIVEELATENNALLISLQDKSQETSRLAVELEKLRTKFDNELNLERSSRQGLESKLQDLVSELNEKNSKLLSFDDLNSELVCLKQMVSDLELEKSKHIAILSRYEKSLRSSHRDSSYICDLESQLAEMVEFSVAAEIQIIVTRSEWEVYVEELLEKHLKVQMALNDSLAQGAQYMGENSELLRDLDTLKSELKVERNLRDKLESRVKEDASELHEKHLLLETVTAQKSQLELLEKMVSDLESEKLSQGRTLLQYEERIRNAQQESSSMDEMFEYLTIADIQFIFMKTQTETYVTHLAEQLSCCTESLYEFQKKHTDVESALNLCLANEAQYVEENTQLLTSLEVLKSELKSSVAKSRALIDTNSAMRIELDKCRTRAENAERSYSEKSLCAREVEPLKDLLARHEEEIENLMILKTQAEITVEVLKDKVAEQCRRDADEIVSLRIQCSELTQKLSEQVLKTEEFKNLSIHLKELKDKAEAECTHAREKTEYQAPLTPQQESLRIIFIKEQYESKLQELKHQLNMSKKHGEEILMKLQDAIDEIEARKKAEATHLKRNEELGDKILGLEAELQSIMCHKREKITAYDMMKAELDCSLLSLECCKEEKQRLEASLQECMHEKMNMSQELALMRKPVTRSSSPENFQMEGHDRLKMEDQMSDELVGKITADKNLITVPLGDPMNHEERQGACSVPSELSNSPRSKIQDNILSGSVSEDGRQLPSNETMALNNGEENLALTHDNFRAETLRSSLDHLNDELERMKNENLLHPRDYDDSDTRFPGLERELMQLRQAKEELRSIFPLSNERFNCGNALERVLALEIELAEALRGKNKSTFHFQSSFLKQHSNDEAIFRSFRDINDLVEEMLETKGRYASMETELKEMHDRYSQLSLKFAEVEGERQKLMMTLKSVRASKKALLSNRSPSAGLGELS